MDFDRFFRIYFKPICLWLILYLLIVLFVWNL